jgi:phage shock protein PspC (stress-responsive transcriptional regulator)
MSSTTAAPTTQPASFSSARAWFADNGLTRPRERRVLAGVSAGLARRYGVDRFVMRLVMIAGVLLLTPLIYLALWVLMPADS